jgi:diguanylate cyclase (GGDEF)-like protein
MTETWSRVVNGELPRQLRAPRLRGKSHPWPRLAPFAVLTAGAQLSAWVPPGPKSPAGLAVSDALFLIAGVACLLSTKHHLSPRLRVLPPLIYGAAALLLLIATGPAAPTGLAGVLLLPVLWTSLYQTPRDSIIVLSAIVFGLFLGWLALHGPPVVFVRRLLLYAGTGAVVSVTIHGLRTRLQDSIRNQRDRARRLRLLVQASHELSSVSDETSVIDTTLKWLTELVAAPRAGTRTAHYLRVDGDSVTVEGASKSVDEQPTFRLDDHPYLRDAVASQRSVTSPIEASTFGPTLENTVRKLALESGAWIPVAPEGELHGVLSVCAREARIEPEVMATCRTIGSLMELALAKALAHKALKEMATTDELTGLTNRRGFEAAVANRPGRLPFVVLSLDLDGLKRINDTFGHAAGDEALRAVAATLQGVMRTGDVLARIGGDEFAAIIFGAEIPAGGRVADRMLEAVARDGQAARIPGLSIGLAQGATDSDPALVLAAADQAMYAAKRAGGMRYMVRETTLSPSNSATARFGPTELLDSTAA